MKNFQVLLKYHKDHHTLKVLIMLKVLNEKQLHPLYTTVTTSKKLNTYTITMITLVKYFTAFNATGDIFFTLHTTLIH